MCYLYPGQRKWFLPPTRPTKMTPSNSLTAPHVFLKFYTFFLFFYFVQILVFMGKIMMTLMNKIPSFISAIKTPLASASTGPPLLFVKCRGHKKNTATLYSLLPKTQYNYKYEYMYLLLENIVSVNTKTIFILQAANLNSFERNLSAKSARL